MTIRQLYYWLLGIAVFSGAAFIGTKVDYDYMFGKKHDVLDHKSLFCEKFTPPKGAELVMLSKRVNNGPVRINGSRYNKTRFNAKIADIIIVQDSSDSASYEGGGTTRLKKIMNKYYDEQVVVHRLNLKRKTMGSHSIMSHAWVNYSRPFNDYSEKAWRTALAKSRSACGVGAKSYYDSGTVLIKTRHNKWYAAHTSEFYSVSSDGDGNIIVDGAGYVDYDSKTSKRAWAEYQRKQHNATVTFGDFYQVISKAGGRFTYPLATNLAKKFEMYPFEVDRLKNQQVKFLKETVGGLIGTVIKASKSASSEPVRAVNTYKKWLRENQ